MPRLIAIGDIHGRLRKLERLLVQVAPGAEDRLVFVGDYIDRGPDSFGVVERLIRLREELPKTVLLRGNHEQMALELLSEPASGLRRAWLEREGGRMTVSSYESAGRFLAHHLSFFRGLPLFFEDDRWFICHAGVRPGVPLEQQEAADLLEIREPFLSWAGGFGKVVVHGHTIVEKPRFLHNRIAIDTGAAEHGPLTAIELPPGKVWQQP